MWFQNDAEFVIEVDPGETDLFRSLFASLCPFLHSLEEFVQTVISKGRPEIQRSQENTRVQKCMEEYWQIWSQGSAPHPTCKTLYETSLTP